MLAKLGQKEGRRRRGTKRARAKAKKAWARAEVKTIKGEKERALL